MSTHDKNFNPTHPGAALNGWVIWDSWELKINIVCLKIERKQTQVTQARNTYEY